MLLLVDSGWVYVNRLESGVLAGTYRPFHPRTQLNDALIESWLHHVFTSSESDRL